MAAWWDRIAGRLDYELAALRADDISATVDEEAKRRGVLMLRLEMPEGTPLTRNLVAVFPDTYPYTRPEVLAPDLKLARHQNPFLKNLCLLGRETTNWRVNDTLAGILRTQLPLLAHVVEVSNPGDLEEAQGEPVSTYLNYDVGSTVFIDSGWNLPPDVRYGRMSLTVLDEDPLRAVVGPLKGADGTRLGRAPFSTTGDQLEAPWVRLPSPVMAHDAQEWMAIFKRTHPIADFELKKKPRVVGFTFPEELGHLTHGDGWVFVSLDSRKARVLARLVRASRTGIQDLATRLPAFSSLLGKRVAVFGLGCIGAPSLLELARAGIGELRFLDPDAVEAGTAVRWPFGIEAAGWPKAAFLLDFVERHFPWVRVVAHEHRVGFPFQRQRDAEVLDQMLADVDLVYDATAELGIQHLLSDLARERGIPYVCISGTPGGVSGVVARISTHEGAGCWSCLQHAMTEAEIDLPQPLSDSQVQPQGCADPTFTGANYDFMEVALQGVRLALATLSGSENPKDDYLWDVAVLRLRDDEGQRIEPRWSVYPLMKDPECLACGTP
jgi:molybdopterin/thiamine biosynthesis adenylyltransferase